MPCTAIAQLFWCISHHICMTCTAIVQLFWYISCHALRPFYDLSQVTSQSHHFDAVTLWLSSCDMAEISCVYEESNQWSLQRSGIVSRLVSHNGGSLYYDCHKLHHSHTLRLSSCDVAENRLHLWGIEPVISAKVWNYIARSRLVSHNGGSIMIVAFIRCLGQVTALRLDPLVDLIFNYMCRGLTPSLFRKQTLCMTT